LKISQLDLKEPLQTIVEPEEFGFYRLVSTLHRTQRRFPKGIAHLNLHGANRMRHSPFITVLAVVAMILVVATFFAAPAQDLAKPVPATKTVNQPGEIDGHVADLQFLHAQLRIVVEQDKTGSATRNLTPQIGADDLLPLIELIKQSGGDLALGLVLETANRPFARLHIEPPPFTPVLKEPSRDLPVLAQNRQWAQYRRQRNARDAADSARRGDQNRDIARFLPAAKSILETPAKAKCTDFWGAMDRAATFHNEPLGPVVPTPRMYTIIISDAEHNCGPYRGDKFPGQVVMVNGNPGMGSLGSTKIRVARFENLPAAVRFIQREVSSR
jgi:hypothetical protein